MQTAILLEYQRLEFKGEELEKQECSDIVQQLLEDIGERQCELLNSITLQ